MTLIYTPELNFSFQFSVGLTEFCEIHSCVVVIFIRMNSLLVGSRTDSRTFIINGELHARLWEADSHLYIYSSPWPLGEINYVIVACRSAKRKKRWFLGSIQVKYISSGSDKNEVSNLWSFSGSTYSLIALMAIYYSLKIWYFPYHEWIEVFWEPVKVTLCGVNPEYDINRRLILGWLGRSFTGKVDNIIYLRRPLRFDLVI